MSFFANLRTGLKKSSGKLSGGITDIFSKRKLDNESVEQLEELLIEADMGASVAAELSAALADQRFDKEVAPEEVREFLASHIAAILEPYAVPINVAHNKPCVIMMVGVNGNGKTTTIGKLAAQFKREGLSVMLAAADTFRAAAVEQLQVWGERSNIPVITGAMESDPASVAFRAYEEAKAKNIDVLMIDTAGRLQNKSNLMAELQKTVKVLKKIDESAPHHIIQVLDATTGQNALSQVQSFKDIIGVTGLIVSKLDGTAKGGIIVALVKQSKLPIHAIGAGEGIDDLGAFKAIDFSKNIMGL